jgi:hypothetical protein
MGASYDIPDSASLGCLKRDNPLRKACVWLIEPGTKPAMLFGNFVLLLIIINCSILAVQTPVSGPAVQCVLPDMANGESYDASKHNCLEETYGKDTRDPHEQCAACQRAGECSCNGPLSAGFTSANFAEESELAFTILFTIEAAVRIIARGFIGHKGAYLRDGWNWLDWIVVVMSWLSQIPGVNNFSAIRTVRVLRPLRTMTRIPGMTTIIGALIGSLAPLGSVVALCVVIFFLFGIFASQVWTDMPKVHCDKESLYYSDVAAWNSANETYRCFNLETHLPTNKACGCDQLENDNSCDLRGGPCIGVERDSEYVWDSVLPASMPADWKVEYNYTAQAPAGSSTGCSCSEVCTADLQFYCDGMGAISFDHIGLTMLTIFQCVTLEGWTDIMYQCDNIENPIVGGGKFYWLLLIFIAGMFAVELALAVIGGAYGEASDEDEAKKKSERRRRLTSIFGDLDVDGSGQVSKAELVEGLKKSNVLQTSTDVDVIMHAGDSDHNGQLSLEEFIALMEESTVLIDDSLRQEKLAKESRCRRFLRTCLTRGPKLKNLAPIVHIRTLVQADGFTAFIMVAIGINTVLLACESHSDDLCTGLELPASDFILEATCMPEDQVDFFEFANTFLTLFFAAEMVLKLIGLGILDYLADPWNQFDGFIVITSLYELIKLTVSDGKGGGGGLTVLRAGRLFRVFRLARSWAALKDVLHTVSLSFGSLLPLSIILGLFMFIFALLGMQLFGGNFFFPERTGCYPWEQLETGCSIPRANFDTFGASFVTIFQMLSGEDWNVVMYDGIRSAGGACFFYFAIIVVFGNFMILNLFLTILLAGFEDDENAEDEIPSPKEDDGNVAPENSKCLCCGGNKVAPEDMNGASGGFIVGDSLPAMTPRTEVAHVLNPMEKEREMARIIPKHAALGCLSTTNPFRVVCFNIVSSPLFDNIVLMCIVLSSATLCIQNPMTHGGPNDSTTVALVLHWLDLIFLVVFTVEMALKHVALGALFHERAYWRNPWNVMDGLIVILAYVGILASDLPQLKPLRAIRTMRALRPLRAARRFPGMKLAVTCLLKSIPLMFPIALVSLLFYLVFAILGVQLFAGRFWYCEVTANRTESFALLQDLLSGSVSADTCRFAATLEGRESMTSAEVVEAFPYLRDNTTEFYKQAQALSSDTHARYYADSLYSWEWQSDNSSRSGFDAFCHEASSLNAGECTRAECRLVGGKWKLQGISHFDNILESLLCVFEMSTTEGWPAVMWSGVDGGTPGHQPKQGQSFVYVIYYILFIIVGNFFVLNLFVGAVLDNYLNLEKEEKEKQRLLTEAQLEWVQQQEKLFRDASPEDLLDVVPAPPPGIRLYLYTVVQHRTFELTIRILIIVNILILAMKHRAMSDTFEKKFLLAANWLFTVAFAVEAIFKLIAYGPKYYFRQYRDETQQDKSIRTVGSWNVWNSFDFFLVLVSIVDKFGNLGGLAGMFRIFRVFRIIRVARSAKTLKQLFQTIIVSIPALVNVGSLLLLLLFIYAILGVNFFFDACGVPPYFTVAADNTTQPASIDEQVFDPCTDDEYGMGYSGFVSVNLLQNFNLWVAYAADTNNDLVLSESEIASVEAGIQKRWPAYLQSSSSSSSSAIGAKVKEARIILPSTNAEIRNALKLWVSDTVTVPSFAKDLVENTDYEERSKYVAERWAWVFNYALDPDGWSGKLRCTQVTTKCDGYREPTQSLFFEFDEDTRPGYAACVCENMDSNANYAYFGVAFITLIRCANCTCPNCSEWISVLTT